MPIPWRYLSEPELRVFLLARVGDGYAFPLNPKWLMCDPGWWDLFEAQMKSADCTAALDSWLPSSSGIRERMARIHEAFPAGFAPVGSAGEAGPEDTIDPDIAELELNRFITLQRAQRKLKALRKLSSSVK